MANIFEQSSQNLATAGNTLTGVAQGGMPAQSMNAYINPYQQQVIGNTMGRMQDQYGINMMRLGDQAEAGGAFGGARHGVREAAETDNFMRQAGEMTTGMNQQGFNTAMGAGFQDVGQQIAASGGLHNLGNTQFGIGQGINQQMMAQGNQQQQLAQTILDLANNDYSGYTNAPFQNIQNIMASLQGNPLYGNQTQSTTTKPGLLDVLGLGAQVGGKYGQAATTGGK